MSRQSYSERKTIMVRDCLSPPLKYFSVHAHFVALFLMFFKYQKRDTEKTLRGVGTLNVRTWDVFSLVPKLATNRYGISLKGGIMS